MKKLVIAVIIILIAIAGGFYFLNREVSDYDFIVVEEQSLIQTVSVTGRVKPTDSVDLSFEQGGRVVSARAGIGDVVRVNEPLIYLSSAELNAQLAEARANLEAQKIKLKDLEIGARSEDIQIKEAELDKVKQDLENSYNSVVDILGEAFTVADDAVRSKTSAMFSGSKNSFFYLTYDPCDTTAESLANNGRLTSDKELDLWESELVSISTASSNTLLESAFTNAGNHLAIFKDFLQKTHNTLTTSCTANNSAYDSYRTNISAARTNINVQISAISELKQTIASRKISITQIEKELNKLVVGSTEEELNIQKAYVEEAEAKVSSILAKIDRNVLRSPIAGVVTRQEAAVGEVVSVGELIVSIISASDLEIETDVPEVDIAEIKLGDSAEISLDAYGNDVVFDALVSAIEPAERVIEGVSTYRVKLQLKEVDDRIKSGMTANIDIITDSKEGAMAVPFRAVISSDGRIFARVLQKDGTIMEKDVITGIRGSAGLVEIVNGLNVGDRVIIFTNN